MLWYHLYNGDTPSDITVQPSHDAVSLLPHLAIINGGFIRGDTIYPTGYMLTYKDLSHEFPFQRATVVVQITGADLLRGIEQHLYTFPNPSGSFPHFSHGMSIIIDTNRKQYHRVVCATLFDTPIDETQMYNIVISSFIKDGGDACDAYKLGVDITKPSLKVRFVIVVVTT
uniref:5'-nucleotidase n=1 Tax=Lygus hesperus TaxID=30085 RepID=A0A0A9ZDK9_LYGHE